MNRNKRKNKQLKYVRCSCGQFQAHSQQKIQNTAAAQLKKMKNKMSKCSAIEESDGSVFLGQKNNNNKNAQRNHIPWCPTETITKWLLQTGISQMLCQVWRHHPSHWNCCMLWKCFCYCNHGFLEAADNHMVLHLFLALIHVQSSWRVAHSIVF